MDAFLLTTAALPRLSLLVLTGGAFADFASRARRSPGSGWLAVALAENEGARFTILLPV